MNRVLVTGVNGFIGGHLVRDLLQSGHEVHGLGRSPNNKHEVSVYHSCDLKNMSVTSDVIRSIQPNIIIHLAGSRLRSEESSAFRNNLTDSVDLTLNVVEACIGEVWLKRFIAIGTCEEYGNLAIPCVESDREFPLTAYAWGKLATTKLLQTLSRTHSFPAVILRPSVAYGPAQDSSMFVSALITALVNGRDFKMTDGAQTRDFLYIDDLIFAIRQAMHCDVNGMVINISSGVEVSLGSLVELVVSIIGGEAHKHVLSGSLPRRHAEVGRYIAINEQAKELLSWEPLVGLEDGIKRTINWYRNSQTV
ncbi:MAG: NAD(P)-dependent oxidoreductase [Acidimicrobiaceae bacterium]|nr:NAD(P)-dependent oxidoreductase [Acidimicrobiaceae bacterium]